VELFRKHLLQLSKTVNVSQELERFHAEQQRVAALCEGRLAAPELYPGQCAQLELDSPQLTALSRHSQHTAPWMRPVYET